MGELRIVGPGKTRGYPYPVCKKRIVSPGKTHGYSYPMCKKEFSSTAKIERTLSYSLTGKKTLHVCAICFCLFSNEGQFLRSSFFFWLAQVLGICYSGRAIIPLGAGSFLWELVLCWLGRWEELRCLFSWKGRICDFLSLVVHKPTIYSAPVEDI